MNLVDASIEEARQFLNENGMRVFEIISYFLEEKYNIITEDHLVMEGWGESKILSEIIKNISEEINNYGIHRLCLSEYFMWEKGYYYGSGYFEFPLGEITEGGKVVMSDLYAKFDIDNNGVKLSSFDVP